MERNFKLGLEFARELDSRDELKEFRQRFYLEEDELYFDGNSLGASSKDAEETLLKVLRVWREEKILIWNVEDGKYFKYPKYLGELSAPLVKADPDEITIGANTTLNIHQALATFYRPSVDRYKILVDELNFPSDVHAVTSQVKLHGLYAEDAVKVVKSRDQRTIEEEDIIEAMTEDIAVVLLSSVLYRSAQLLDMERITKIAHERGIIIGWDLSHSIGSVPHDFKKINPDFAVWCTYKHLSGGPGSNAALYINKKHFLKEPGLAGWFGNKKETQFLMDHKHQPAPDADGWLTGTPNLLSMAPMEGALKLFNEAGIERVREKSLLLTDYLIFLIENRLEKYGFANGTPLDHNRRGGHIALEHEEAYRISLALKEKRVIPDFREPNVIRLAPVALYSRFEDVHRVVDVLEEIMVEGAYEKFSNERDLVV